MKLYNFTFASFLIALVFTSCQSELSKHIPEKSEDQSLGKYDKYLKLLTKAYEEDNKFEAALQLSNLNADKKIIFEYLNVSIKEDDSNCDQLYEWYWLYDRHDFGVNLVKADPVLYKESIKLCDGANDKNSYASFAIMKDEEEKHAIESRPLEDSTKFNLSLVKELEQIHSDDQEVRIRLNKKTVTPGLKKEILKEMQIVDSINLVKIDKIFNEYGYPSRELVGKDGNFTPALVIHHSNSLEDRIKYLPLLEKAVEDGILYEGTLNMIKRRMEDMKLDQINNDL